MRISFGDQACADLDGIFTWIAQDDPTSAARVVDRIVESAAGLARFPRIGRLGRVSGTFEWVVPGLPYVVVYTIDEARQELAVVAIFHGAQDR